ncbi:MAG: retroviral-like aspartic protease family protein, partial [Candidatus Aminicenantes bacterium]|nr:retroviral-like aspartic protease family protein [Candidatus Aminicenantes bacterium]
PLFRKAEERKTKFSWYYLIPVVILLLIGGYFLISTSFNRPSQDLTTANVEKENLTDTQDARSGSSSNELLTGDVIIRDFSGSEIARSAAAAMRGNWIALPIGMMIGGSSLVFQTNEEKSIPVESVLWSDNDPVVLCRFIGENTSASMDLQPWKLSAPLEWRPLLGKASLQLEILSTQERGLFSSFQVPPELDEPGVFLQSKKIVGWTFGEGKKLGFVWTGSAGTDLLPNQDIDQFYFLVLSDSRETQMVKALELDGTDISPEDKLDAYAESFRLPSKFLPEDLPLSLDLGAVLNRMHILASELIESGSAGEVIRILDERVLMETLNPALIEDVVISRVEYEDSSRAIAFLNNLKSDLLSNEGGAIPGFDNLLCNLYKDWLEKILAGEDFYNGLIVFEEARKLFPDDLELHLLGVELAAAENEFALANDLLLEKKYPPQLIKQAEYLQAVLSQRQEEEETIVIYFNPREKQIPVEAYVNRSHKMRFFIDTGATTCSIPPNAVEMLGIEITENTPMVSVSVPGAVGLSYEVFLRSIEIEGHLVNNVRALVIEIPSHPDSGLLGLDFLNKFNMEIDNERGILKLRAR